MALCPTTKPVELLHEPRKFATLVIRLDWYKPLMSEKLRDPEGFSASQKKAEEPRLSTDDQAKVDDFLQRGVNAVERKPFRPAFLIFLLIAVVTGFSLLSQGIAQWAGVY